MVTKTFTADAILRHPIYGNPPKLRDSGDAVEIPIMSDITDSGVEKPKMVSLER